MSGKAAVYKIQKEDRALQKKFLCSEKYCGITYQDFLKDLWISQTYTSSNIPCSQKS